MLNKLLDQAGDFLKLSPFAMEKKVLNQAGISYTRDQHNDYLKKAQENKEKPALLMREFQKAKIVLEARAEEFSEMVEDMTLEEIAAFDKSLIGFGVVKSTAMTASEGMLAALNENCQMIAQARNIDFPIVEEMHYNFYPFSRYAASPDLETKFAPLTMKMA